LLHARRVAILTLLPQVLRQQQRQLVVLGLLLLTTRVGCVQETLQVLLG